jgi:hypothetical protein
MNAAETTLLPEARRSFRRVILETPYHSDTPAGIAANETYARMCLRDCLLRGEAPIASHLLYTQPGVLLDSVPEERTLGIEAGLAWGWVADATVVYTDRGVSSGMQKGVERAQAENRPVEMRALQGRDPGGGE